MIQLHLGDCLSVLRTMEAGSVQCCVTSPPYYGLRDYGAQGQIGLEPTPDEYVTRMVGVFREVRRVLRDDGVLWLNLGDSYAGGGGFAFDAPCNVKRREAIASGQSKDGAFSVCSRQHERNKSGGIKPAGTLKAKDLVGIPWRVAFALQADGWWLRSDCIWHKPNPMPESVRDRPTKSHEYVFLLAKSERYFWDAGGVREAASEPLRPAQPGYARAKPGDPYASQNGGMWGEIGSRNIRSVWTITPKPFKGAHFATMPIELAERCIKAGSREGDTVLDPFNGAGTTGIAALRLGRSYVGIELNPEYLELSRQRIADEQAKQPLLSQA
jgi:DNA modification methylase